MKIYTKTGDQGDSGLYNGERRSKSDHIFEALGTSDELSSQLGVAKEFCKDDLRLSQLQQRIEKIQCVLQDAGSHIATPRLPTTSEKRRDATRFDNEGRLVADLEAWIDEYTAMLPRLTQFILPSGGKPSAFLHVSRCICRRLERRLVPLLKEECIEESLFKYINRLSDFLFTAARYVCHTQQETESVYRN